MHSSHVSRASIVATIGVVLAAHAGAQGLIATQGTLVAVDGDPVPDAQGVALPGLTFGGANALTDNCVADATGRLLFRARMTGGTQTGATERAYFYGASRADLRMVVRGGDQAPGLASGVVLSSAGGGLTPLTSSVRLTSDGQMMWGADLEDPTHATVNSTNDEALFGGPFGAQTCLVRKGDPAPGTVGATFIQAFTSTMSQMSGMNAQGRIHFTGALTGGDTVGTLNQAGIWSGLPGALELVARRGTLAPGLNGEEVSSNGAAFGQVGLMNESGAYLYQLALSTTSGTPAATIATDTVLMQHVPGAGSTLIVREGDPVPGTSNGATLATLNAVGDYWQPGLNASVWTNTNETLFTTELSGGDAVLDVNDRALCRARVGALEIVARRGAIAPGTTANFDDFHVASLGLAVSGRVAFRATLTGGASTQADDTGIWTGRPGALQLVVREGDAMPGTGGSTAGHVSPALVQIDDLGQVLFQVPLVGGLIVGNSLWVWDPVLGLTPIVLPGDQIEVAIATFRTISTFSVVGLHDGDGATLGFGRDGRIALRVGFTDGTGAIATVRLPVATTTPTAFCFGDGSATACPCGNSGAPGRGCANSVEPSGARLSGSGWARIGGDSLVLFAEGMPVGAARLFQGTVQQNGGAGIPFADGLRCVGGTLVTIRTKLTVGGESIFPQQNEPPVSIAGGIVQPGTRTYQVMYRNAASFCTTLPFNLTNGVEVVWFP